MNCFLLYALVKLTDADAGQCAGFINRNQRVGTTAFGTAVRIRIQRPRNGYGVGFNYRHRSFLYPHLLLGLRIVGGYNPQTRLEG